MATTLRPRHLLFAAGVIVVAVGGYIAGMTFFGGTSAPSRTNGSQASAALPLLAVGQWVGRRPAIVDFSADAGNIASGLTWTSWTHTRAVGHGTWNYLDCVPNCASGHSTPYPVTITLDRPVGGFFTRLVEQTSGPHGFTQTFTAPHLGNAACSENDSRRCGL